MKKSKRVMVKEKLLLFTFVLEFRGGIYLAQIQAPDVNNAILGWLEYLNMQQGDIEHMGPATYNWLMKQWQNGDIQPQTIESMTNIWFMYLEPKVGSMFVNIVQTVDH